jgi:uncharacterized protein (TIGR03435 family)
MTRLGFLLALASLAAYGQTADGQPSFEVASIKPAPPPEPGRMFMGNRGGPGTKDPGLWVCTNCPVMLVILQAYDIQPYQLSGVTNTERFNITAKLPEGATKAQFRLMLQNLLAERFKLKIHRESKDSQVYELVVAKGGYKMKESAEKPDDGADGLPPPPPPGGRGRPQMDANGYPVMPAGCNGCMMVGPGGKARAQYQNETMQDFAKTIGGQLGKPVTDATGLTGRFDFSIAFDMSAMAMGGKAGAILGPPPGGLPGPGPGAESNAPLGSSDNEPGVTLISAIQSQLGLKLEQKKGKIETIVVDHVEKLPTEN